MPLGRARVQGGATLDDVRLDEVDAFATSLPGVRRKGHPGRVAWYVDDRLVVREDLPGAEREDLLARHPETFGVPGARGPCNAAAIGRPARQLPRTRSR